MIAETCELLTAGLPRNELSINMINIVGVICMLCRLHD